MKRLIVAAGLAIAALSVLSAQNAAQGPKLLYVYDESNKQSAEYVTYFREALAQRGIPYDETTAAGLQRLDLAHYDTILMHGMVMAFNSKSPLRDWLKTGPSLAGKQVHLFVTANRWFVDKLLGQLEELLRKDQATLADAVSMATKDLKAADKQAAVQTFVRELRP